MSQTSKEISVNDIGSAREILDNKLKFKDIINSFNQDIEPEISFLFYAFGVLAKDTEKVTLPQLKGALQAVDRLRYFLKWHTITLKEISLGRRLNNQNLEDFREYCNYLIDDMVYSLRPIRWEVLQQISVKTHKVSYYVFDSLVSKNTRFFENKSEFIQRIGSDIANALRLYSADEKEKLQIFKEIIEAADLQNLFESYEVGFVADRDAVDVKNNQSPANQSNTKSFNNFSTSGSVTICRKPKIVFHEVAGKTSSESGENDHEDRNNPLEEIKKSIKEFWHPKRGRGSQENPAEFISRVYHQYLGDKADIKLRRGYLLEIDEKLYRAYATHIRRNPDDDLNLPQMSREQQDSRSAEEILQERRSREAKRSRRRRESLNRGRFDIEP